MQATTTIRMSDQPLSSGRQSVVIFASRVDGPMLLEGSFGVACSGGASRQALLVHS